MKNVIVMICIAGILFLLQGFILPLFSQEEEIERERMEVTEYVKQIFVHGIPYEEASKFTADDIPPLVRMLEDRNQEEHWVNTVVVLGMIGNDNAVDPLMNFINREVRNTLSDPHYRAKTSAIVSLGYIINKTNNRRAQQFLIESLNPEIWDRRDFRWRSPYHQTAEERNMHLSTMAVLGLALSGTEEAAGALRNLQQPGRTEIEQRFRREVAETLQEALEANEIIAREGLIGYYRQSQEKWRGR